MKKPTNIIQNLQITYKTYKIISRVDKCKEAENAINKSKKETFLNKLNQSGPVKRSGIL